MNTWKTKRRVLALCVSLALVTGADLAFTAAPAAWADATCKTIHAVHQDALLPAGPGCPSPVGFCAAGDSVRGNHGFRGSFFFSAISFVPIPEATIEICFQQ
jgi:hypothetical protein